MNKNDDILNYVDSIVNNNKYVEEARNYIRENFNISSDYDEENGRLYIYTTNVNEGLSLLSAKLYLNEIFTPEIMQVVYGMKNC